MYSLSESQRITALKQRFEYITAISNQSCCMCFYAECWWVVKGDMNKINAFRNRCLRRICCIFWHLLVQFIWWRTVQESKEKECSVWNKTSLHLMADRTVSQRLSLDGHHLGKGDMDSLKQLGGVQWQLSWRRWVWHGVRHNMLPRTKWSQIVAKVTITLMKGKWEITYGLHSQRCATFTAGTQDKLIDNR